MFFRATSVLQTQLLSDADIEHVLKSKLFIKLFHFDHLEVCAPYAYMIMNS
jgi:hypothetical protein